MTEIWQPKSSDNLKRYRLHATLFAQAFSPCGKYLAVGSSFGHIAVYSLPSALSPEATEKAVDPFLVFTGNQGAVYSLKTTERLLVGGNSEGIQAWLWSDIIAKNPKIVWCFAIPTKDHFFKAETNTLAVSSEADGSRLYGGCGDNNVHVWDLESGKHLCSFEGHEDYIHSIALLNSPKECVSASEDGSVRIWDTRKSGGAISVLEPYKHDTCARPQIGKWVSCVAVDKADDWMVCGGGPHLCLWHLRSLTPTTVFSTQAAHNTVLFQEDSLISAGHEAFVYHWSVNGDQRGRVPCSPTIVFDVSINNNSENTRVLSIAGNCNKTDICTNFGYRAFSMNFY